jgi:PPP family 3-phenylpropionic acid transporter
MARDPKVEPVMGTSAPPSRVSYSIRLAAFYGALFTIYGVHLPYFPVWLNARGITAEEIAAITAAPYFLRVFITPSVAVWADRTETHRTIINVLAWMALILALLFAQMESFWTIFLFAVPFAIALSTSVPLTETIAVAGVRAHGLDYGRMRLWGSVTFVAAGFAAGWLIDHTGPGAVIGCILAGAVATVVCAWLLPERARTLRQGRGGQPQTELAAPASDDLATPIIPEAPSGPPESPAGKTRQRNARRLVSNPLFFAFLVAAGAAQGAHGMFYTFGALQWQTQGISTSWVGVLWAIAIVGEVALFAYSGNVVRLWGPQKLLVIATFACVVRWVLMSLSPPLAALVALQTLHTLTYGASHLGAMHFISRAVPETAQGTAQALYATVASGLVMGAATLTSGWLYAKAGPMAYLAMAGLALIGFAAALIILARCNGDLLWNDDGASATHLR